MHSHREALLIEAHRIIADAASEAIDTLARSADSLSYPPGAALTNEELEVLSAVARSDVGRAALRKVLADAAASSFFHFLSLVDGVADPQVIEFDEWLGLELIQPTDDSDRPMLHDDFYESYWEYQRASESG